MPRQQAADFLIVAPLEEEREAVLRHLPGALRQAQNAQDGRIYFVAELAVSPPGGAQGTYRVVVASPAGMGRVDAALATGDAIRQWQPRFVLLVGIAGGVGAEVAVGDVMIADQVFDYEQQKLMPCGPSVRWQGYRADARLLTAARHLVGWTASIQERRPGPGTPAAHVGPVLSGDKVMADREAVAAYLEMIPKAVGIEMEAGGVAGAAHQSVDPPGVLMIRGVSDLADPHKSAPSTTAWRLYACDVAAAFAVALLRSTPVPVSAGAEELPSWGGPPGLRTIDFRGERARHGDILGREDILAEIDRLLDDPAVPAGFVLLTGAPGTGKSAIVSAWLAAREARGQRVPHHFLGGSQEWARPATIRRSLLSQLAAFFPEVAPASRVEHGASLLEQLGAISAQALRDGRRLVLAMDGLDEAMADDPDDNPLPRMLPASLPPGVFFLCASRPTYPDLEWLGARGDLVRRISLDEEPWRSSSERACRTYLRAHAGDFTPPLGPGLIEEAVRQGEGNLLHAVKLREWLLEHPTERAGVARIPRGLLGLLEQIWQRLRALPPSHREVARSGLALLCAAREPLPLRVVAAAAVWSMAEEADLFLRVARPFLREVPAGPEGAGEAAYAPFHEVLREFTIGKLGGPAALAPYHGQLADAAAPWPPPEGDAFSRGYATRQTLAHRAGAGRWHEVDALVHDVDLLTAKCRLLGGVALEDELAQLAAGCPDEPLRAELALLREVLRSESHWLWQDPDALGSLLYGRLRCLGWSAERIEGQLRWRGRLPRLRLRRTVGQVPDGSLRTLAGHTASVHACRFTPDGRRVVSAGWDGTLRVWEVESGRQAAVLAGHEPMVMDCAVSPDGTRLLSAGRDGTLRLWDLAACRPLRTIPVGDGHLVACGLLPDGRRAVSVAETGTVRVWDLETGQSLGGAWRAGHHRTVMCAALTPDGALLATGSLDQTIRITHLESGREVASLEGHDRPVDALSVTPDGRRLVSGGMDGTVRLWDLWTGRELRALRGHGHWVSSVAVSPDGAQVLSGSQDDTLRLWRSDTGALQATFHGHASGVVACAISPDCQRAVSGSPDGTLKLWDLRPRPRAAADRPGHDGRVLCCAITPGGRRAVTGSTDETVKVWDLESGDELQTLRGHRVSVLSCALLPGGTQALTASYDRTLRLWDLEGASPPRVLRGHRSSVCACVVTSDGGRALSGAFDGTIRLWDLGGGQLLSTLRGHAPGVRTLALSPEGALLFSGGHDHLIRVWDWEHGQLLLTLSGHQGAVWGLAVSPDGRRLLSGADDQTLRLWDLATGSELRTLTGHTAMVTGCAISADGRWGFSASDDQTVRLWDLDTGVCLETLYGRGAFTCLALAGDTLYAGDNAGALWVLRVHGPPPLPTAAPDDRALRGLLRRRRDVAAEAARARARAAEEEARHAGERAAPAAVIGLAAQLEAEELSEDELGRWVDRLWEAGEALREQQPAAALDAYERILDLGRTLPPAFDRRLAQADTRRVGALLALGQHDTAERALGAVSRKWEGAGDPEIRMIVATTLIVLARRADEVKPGDGLHSWMEVIRLFIADREPQMRLLVAGALMAAAGTLGIRQQDRTAIVLYRMVLTRFSDLPELELLRLDALHGLARALARLRRHRPALRAFETVICRCWAGPEKAQGLLAAAMLNRGQLLADMGRRDEALAAWEMLAARLGGSASLAVRRSVLRGRLLQAGCMAESDPPGALAVVQAATRRLLAMPPAAGADAPADGDADDRLEDLAAGALSIEATLLRDLGRWEEAIVGFREIAQRFPGSTPNGAFYVAGALYDLGRLLQEAYCPQEALAAYDEALRRFSQSTDPGVRDCVQRALHNKRLLLAQLGDEEAALQATEQIMQHAELRLEQESPRRIAKSLFEKALKLGQMGQLAQAVQVCDQTLARFSADLDQEIVEVVARVLSHKGWALAQMSQEAAAEAVLDQVVSRFADDPSPVLMELGLRALFNKAAMRMASDRFNDALALYEEVCRRAGSNEDEHILGLALESHLHRGEIFDLMGRRQDAILSFYRVIEQRLPMDSPRLRRIVMRARANLDALIRG